MRLDRDPFTGEGNEALLTALGDATEAVNGVRSPVTGLNAWTDAALMQEAGIPTVLFGPEGGNYHAADEWVSIPDVIATAEILRQTVVALLGRRAMNESFEDAFAGRTVTTSGAVRARQADDPRRRGIHAPGCRATGGSRTRCSWRRAPAPG